MSGAASVHDPSSRPLRLPPEPLKKGGTCEREGARSYESTVGAAL